jgi:hypothetical protein
MGGVRIIPFHTQWIIPLLQPFRLACPNCSSKILVRHAHLVGQTLPCPKCKSPLKIAVPADPLFPAPVPEKIESARRPLQDQAVNSAALTKSDEGDWNLEHLETQAISKLDIPGSDPAAASAHAPQSRESLTSVPPQNRSSDSATVATANRDPRAWESPKAWESQNTVARRNLLLVSAIAVGGLLLASLAFFAFVRSFGKSSDRIANTPAAEQTATKPEANPAEQLQDKPVDAKPIDEKPPISPKIEPESPPKQNAPTPPKADDFPAPPITPQQTPPPSPAPGVPFPENSSPTSPLFPEANVEGTDLVKDNSPEAPLEEKLPSIFEDFQRWIDAPSRGNWDDIGKADRTIDSEIALENTEVLFREEYYPAAIPIPSWEERAQRTLGSIKAPPMPLLRCIDWFSKLSNTGITVDWLDLQLAGVDWSEPMVIEGQNVTIGELLTQLLATRGLELVVDEAGFPHVRPGQERMQAIVGPDGVLNIENALKILSVEQRDSWVPILIRMLDISSGTYEQGRVIWAPEATVYDTARLAASIHALHEAASQPPVQVNFPHDSFDFIRPQAWWILKQRLQAKIGMDRIVYEERPIVDLLASGASASETKLVIDWPAVWSHGLHPSKLSMSILRGRTLEEVANRYLEDYALELVALDSTTVLLTTDAVRRSMEQVVPVRLDRGMAIEDIKGAVRYLVPRGADQRSRFRWEPVPGNEQLALLRICLPALIHLRDGELQKALGFE